MMKYALLILPAFNRVYGESAVQLTQAELKIFSMRAFTNEITDISETIIGGVSYVTFTAEKLTSEEIALISNLSSVYALFAIEGELLRPLTVQPLAKVSSDLLTIQKYSGKTNEHFTKLLLNVTLLNRANPTALLQEKLTILDPMCGRGTTLNQALMYGYHAYGIDIDRKDFESYTHFIKTWLKNKRMKHQAEVSPIRRHKISLGRQLTISFGLTKEEYKSGHVTNLTVVNGDTICSREFFRSNSVDAIVTDAPYGVQHGSTTRAGDLSRKPLELLAAALPSWLEILRPGGALGISWNTHVAPRHTLVELLVKHGLTVQDDQAYREFSHRVDQAIIRDLVVAQKP